MKNPPDELAARLLAASPQFLGPDGLPRFEQVAERVGVSRATLYYYFSGQDDLLGFLLRAHVAAGAAAMAAADPGDGPVGGRLRAVLNAVVGYLGEHPGMCTGLLAAAASGGAMGDVLALNDARIAGPLRELLVAGIATGEFELADGRDGANAMLGAIVLAVVGRAAEARDPAAPDFRAGLVEQLVRGLTR